MRPTRYPSPIAPPPLPFTGVFSAIFFWCNLCDHINQTEYRLKNNTSLKKKTLTTPGNLLTPNLFTMRHTEEIILFYAAEANRYVATHIHYSCSAKNTLEKQDEWHSLMTIERIKAYSTAAIKEHRKKTTDARRVSRQLREKLLQSTKRKTITIAEIAEIANEVGLAHGALNCGAQAAMALHYLIKRNVIAEIISVEGIDHSYLALIHSQTKKRFAILDPWTGLLFRLNSIEAQRYSKMAYQFFQKPCVKLTHSTVTQGTYTNITLEKPNTLQK